MSRDKMLPGVFKKLHPRFQTPYLGSIIVGIAVSIIAGLTPIEIMGNLASTGTLVQYIIVSIIVLYLRRTKPELERPFRCPYVNIIAPVAILLCCFLIYSLLSLHSYVFLAWAVVGILIYAFYSRKAANHLASEQDLFSKNHSSRAS
jgi:APA family basic amino acid/polyamine antiporter